LSTVNVLYHVALLAYLKLTDKLSFRISLAGSGATAHAVMSYFTFWFFILLII